LTGADGFFSAELELFSVRESRWATGNAYSAGVVAGRSEEEKEN
jgi:hypothetical protein